MTREDLRAFRVVHGLTQKAVAEILGLGRVAVVDLENGRRAIPKWVGMALAAHVAGLPSWTAPEHVVRAVKARRRLRIDGRAAAALVPADAPDRPALDDA